jgi:acetolactate synthase-1/2/3 large subunit
MKDKKSLRGGQLLAKSLKEKGVDHVFTLAGGFCNPALEGFMNYQMPVINCPHEQIAGHLADGHTRLTRKPSVCIVGPEGFANAIPAMMEAWGERSPVIFITGSSTLKKQGAGGFKEIDDVAIAKPLTKYSASITDGTRVSEFVDRAWRIATSGYPGPVHLSMPVDIMFSSFPEEDSPLERPYNNKAPEIFRAWPEPRSLESIIEIIKRSKKPIIIGGHGIWWSKTEHLLKQVGDEIQIPIFNVPYHQKLLSEDCEAFLGLADVHQYHPSKFAFNESDCILIIGGRLDNQMNFGNPPLFPSKTKLICINGSHEEIEFNRSSDHLLLSDPGAFFESLLELNKNNEFSFNPNWLEENKKERQKWITASVKDLARTTDGPAWSGGKIHPLQLSLSVQSVLKNDDILVFDGGNTHFWSEIAVNIAGKNGLSLHQIMHPGSYSMLGVGVSFALSAKNLNPSKTVVLISGDGAFLSGGLSIETAFQEKLPIVVIIDNNGGLDCISQQQERLFKDGSHFATDFRDIPFHGLFSGMGGYGELVTHRDEIEGAVKRAIESGKPACVNIKTKGVISPIVAATSDKRDKASIE